MRNIKKIKDYVVIALIIVATVIACILSFSLGVVNNRLYYIFIVLVSLVIVLALILSYCLKLEKIFKASVVISAYVITFSLLFIIMKYTGVLDKLGDVQGLKEIISKSGSSAIIIFFGLSLVQVLFIPIPAVITILAGSLIFGPTTAFLVCSTGIILGSLIAFAIGRIFGKKVLQWIDEKNTAGKYLGVLEKKGGIVLFLMFLLPLFPDDLLCILAGTTNIRTKDFIIISVVARTIGIAAISFFGSGKIIPYSGWGIGVWIVLAIIAVIMVIMVSRYKTKIER